MFKINDSVIHCREGLSTIIAINNMNGKDYFLVSVKHNSGETIYVPVETAESIIRPLMDKKAADELLKYIKIDTEYFFKTLKKVLNTVIAVSPS